MHLLQILLPLYARNGTPLSGSLFEQIKDELTQKFGGLTAYTRSPASGSWKKGEDEIIKDDIYVYEVMAEELDKPYWNAYKHKLQQLFDQEEIIIRATEMMLL